MFRRLTRSYSTGTYENLLTTQNGQKNIYKNYSTNPLQTERFSIKSSHSTRSSSFYDLVCRKCYNTRKLQNRMFDDPNPVVSEKEKLTRSFTSASPFIFQENMMATTKAQIQDKVNQRIAIADRAFASLLDYKIKNRDKKQELQSKNQSTQSGIDWNVVDPRYARLKRKYDLKEKLIDQNRSMYNIDQPRKAVEDYYNKVQYDVPLLEPENKLSEDYKRNFVNDLKRQIELKKKKAVEDKKRDNYLSRLGFEQYNSYQSNKKIPPGYNYKGLCEENKKLEKYRRASQKKEKQDDVDDERRCLNLFQKRCEDDENQKRLAKNKDNDMLRAWKKNRDVENRKKQYENLKEKGRWKNYSEEFIIRCQHGNDISRCAICNRIYPKDQMFKMVKSK